MSIELTRSMKDITGMRFGTLVAIEPVGKRKSGGVLWRCKCDCGNEIVTGCNALVMGRTKSCGARYHRTGKKHFKTHGDTNTRLYHIYAGIKSHCDNPNDTGYCWYGARGIKMCNEWMNDYESFKSWSLANGYADALSIDRIDPNKDYSPENCRWADIHTQSNNKRNSHWITYNGQTKTLQEWSEEYGISRSLIFKRLKEGMSIEEAFNTPVPDRHHYLTFNGETKTITEWGDKTGLGVMTIQGRLKRNWDVEKALTTPKRR